MGLEQLNDPEYCATLILKHRQPQDAERVKTIEGYVIRIFKKLFVDETTGHHTWQYPFDLQPLIDRQYPEFAATEEEAIEACRNLYQRRILASQQYEYGVKYAWNKNQPKE